ncbi:hypothetical protein FOZG_06067 [Fusarium oxysporum Fo47]|uniref:Uncharacterized protein n=1 Tax=Fusarium oxysporum Fo47 TaxID=660027 RepID=W9KUZ6_FUSOX|nr:hypothetical protein FOZG_06067 [Fusarium oxysporum Fo47]
MRATTGISENKEAPRGRSSNEIKNGTGSESLRVPNGSSTDDADETTLSQAQLRPHYPMVVEAKVTPSTMMKAQDQRHDSLDLPCTCFCGVSEVNRGNMRCRK